MPVYYKPDPHLFSWPILYYFTLSLENVKNFDLKIANKHTTTSLMFRKPVRLSRNFFLLLLINC